MTQTVRQLGHAGANPAARVTAPTQSLTGGSALKLLGHRDRLEQRGGFTDGFLISEAGTGISDNACACLNVDLSLLAGKCAA